MALAQRLYSRALLRLDGAAFCIDIEGQFATPRPRSARHRGARRLRRCCSSCCCSTMGGTTSGVPTRTVQGAWPELRRSSLPASRAPSHPTRARGTSPSAGNVSGARDVSGGVTWILSFSRGRAPHDDDEGSETFELVGTHPYPLRAATLQHRRCRALQQRVAAQSQHHSRDTTSVAVGFIVGSGCNTLPQLEATTWCRASRSARALNDPDPPASVRFEPR